MATVFPKNNLPEPAQPWAREVQKQLANVIVSDRANEINNAARDNQLNSSLISLTRVANDASAAINGLLGLGSPTSEYSVNASNITAGTITGSTVQTSTTTGVSLNNETNSISFRVGSTTVGHILPLNDLGILIHHGSNPDASGSTFPQVYVSGSIVALNLNTTRGFAVNSSGSTNRGPLFVDGSLSTNSFISGSSLSVSSVSASSVNGGSGTFNSELQSSNIPGNGLGGGAVDVFASSTLGRLGVATSSQRTKQEINSIELNVNSILSIEPKSFKYNIDVEEFGLENAPEVVGFIAEDLINAGLNKFVQYGQDGLPWTIPYSKYVVALQAVVRNLNERITTLENGAS